MTDLTANGVAKVLPAHGVSFGEALRVWLRVAALSFGGPAGQIAVMHRIIVDEKRWVGERRFLHALSYCMLLPGPEAQQLATYIGWLMHRWPGAIAAGGLFVVPGIIAIMVLSWIYALYGHVPIVAALFFGLKAAVLAIVLFAVYRVGRRALRSGAMIALAALAFIAIFFSHVPFPLIVLAAGLIGYVGARAGSAAFVVGEGHGSGRANAVDDSRLGEELPVHARPTVGRALRVSAIWLLLWLGPVVAIFVTLGLAHTFSEIGGFFSKMAVVTFGGAYAVLAYMAQQAVDTYGWLQPGEMLDGLGMAETTPGPLISWSCSSSALWPRTATRVRCRPCSPAPWADCWRPGRPSCRASYGSGSARPSSSACATTSRCRARSPASPRRSSASSSTWRSGSRCTRSFARPCR